MSKIWGLRRAYHRLSRSKEQNNNICARIAQKRQSFSDWNEHKNKGQDAPKNPRKGMVKMFYNRKFQLAYEKARACVDLRAYEDLIRTTAERVVPDATVVVKRDYFVIDKLTQGQSRRLGRELSKTELVEHRQMVCRLFTGSTTTEEERKQLYEKRKRKN